MANESRFSWMRRRMLYNEKLKRGESGRLRNLDTPLPLEKRQPKVLSEEEIVRKGIRGR